jgi:hypothetical protein
MPKEVQVTNESTVIAEPEDIAQQTPNMDLQQLLDVLVPPTNIKITDIFGNEYSIPSACSARAQVKILQQLNKLKNNEAVQSALKDGLDFNEISELVGIIVGVAADPEVMEGIANAFALAHPKPYRSTCATAKEQDVEYQDAADLFSVEELAGAVVPLFIRLVRKGTSAIATLNQATAGIA